MHCTHDVRDGEARAWLTDAGHVEGGLHRLTDVGHVEGGLYRLADSLQHGVIADVSLPDQARRRGGCP